MLQVLIQDDRFMPQLPNQQMLFFQFLLQVPALARRLLRLVHDRLHRMHL